MKRPPLGAALAGAWLLAAATQLAAQSPASPTPWPLGVQPPVADPQPTPPPPVPPADDRTSILRFDPFENKLVPVPSEEIKPGHLYNRYHERLGRRVWSLATEGGGFEYAMGEGSTQPANLLDLRGTPQQRREAVETRAPGLAEIIRERGGVPYVRLNAAQGWELVPFSSIASVWDLETLQRWEWHGSRRTGIVHTFGNSWVRVGDKYEPALFYPSVACQTY